MNNKLLLISLAILFAAAAALVWAATRPDSPVAPTGPPAKHAVVVYGGSFAACAAAYQAAAHLPPEHEVLLIVPESALGSIGTVGGQNFFDLRNWRGAPPTRGSLHRWREAFGQGYPTAAMAEFLHAEIAAHFPDQVQILFRHEIERVHTDPARKRITGLTVRPVAADPETGRVEWAGESRNITGRIFIDASDNGRLSRLAGVPLSPGRLDWAGDAHQQAATLMFQVTGVDPQAAKAYRHPETGRPEFFYHQEVDGSRLGWGGKEFTRYDPVVAAYNRADHRFTLKGYNIAEDAPGRWWLNILLIHEVNGLLQEIDRDTDRWPTPELTAPGQWSTDRALAEARAELERPRFLEALRRFPGFENVELVRDAHGRPVTGEVLYLRETAHAVQADGSFGLTADAIRHAGDAPDNGADRHLYPTRLGLGLYYIDINAYRKGEPVQTLETPENPHYIPYEALLTPAFDNLLLPGYTQSTASEAWASMRVIPNLAVCGDAAGMVAAYSAAHKKSPAALDLEDLREIQDLLRAVNARLDK